MKISKIYIRDFDQFQNVELDFTNPQTGNPLDKVCFIGRNGTGKSKVLRLINSFLNSLLPGMIHMDRRFALEGNFNSRMVFKIIHQEKPLLLFYNRGKLELYKTETLSKTREQEFIDLLLGEKKNASIETLIQSEEFKNLIESTRHQVFLNELILGNNSTDLAIYSPDESPNNGYLAITDVPHTSVNDALSLFQSPPVFVVVSSDTVSDFWKLLIYNLKKRDEEREKFERAPENINKTKAQLIKEFDKISPKILDDLGRIWNKILEKAGLEFDVKGANNPIQLTDNLKAYVRLKTSKKTIPYSNLSTGIRNFIFRVGHIYSLYFDRQIKRGFLLIDEPENGLFPDFLFELMETYEQIVLDKDGDKNTQMFFATHNPIIAAQFKPFERIILDWNDDATVKVYKGVAPEGDDPNDVLKKDFGLHELMGPAGVEQWAKYLHLRKELKNTQSIEEKMTIAATINKIGQSYNFPA